jgi:hypothetical protein
MRQGHQKQQQQGLYISEGRRIQLTAWVGEDTLEMGSAWRKQSVSADVGIVLWRRVDQSVNANVSEEHAASIFTPEHIFSPKEGSTETFLSNCKCMRCYSPEDNIDSSGVMRTLNLINVLPLSLETMKSGLCCIYSYKLVPSSAPINFLIFTY